MVRNLVPELEQQIRAVIGSILNGYDYEIRGITPGYDWSEDEAIFIELWYKLNQRAFDSELMSSLQSAVLSTMAKYVENRFPYIRHHLHEGQRLKVA